MYAPFYLHLKELSTLPLRSNPFFLFVMLKHMLQYLDVIPFTFHSFSALMKGPAFTSSCFERGSCRISKEIPVRALLLLDPAQKYAQILLVSIYVYRYWAMQGSREFQP